ncbi:hypothetical protein JCM10213_007058 [Rhodosporidiobolus nylandii]
MTDLEVFVGGLGRSATEESLRKFLDEKLGMGTVVSLRLKSKAGKSFAFVQLVSPEAVNAALDLNGELLQGSPIIVDFPRSKLLPTPFSHIAPSAPSSRSRLSAPSAPSRHPAPSSYNASSSRTSCATLPSPAAPSSRSPPSAHSSSYSPYAAPASPASTCATLVEPPRSPRPRDREKAWRANTLFPSRGSLADAARRETAGHKLQVLANVRKRAGGQQSSGSAKEGDLSLDWHEDEGGEYMVGTLYDYKVDKRRVQKDTSHEETRRQLDHLTSLVELEVYPWVTRRTKFEIATRGLEAGWKHLKEECQSHGIELPKSISDVAKYKKALSNLKTFSASDVKALQRSTDILRPILIPTLSFLLAMQRDADLPRNFKAHQPPTEREWWVHLGLFLAQPKAAWTAAVFHKVDEMSVEKALLSAEAVQEWERATEDDIRWLFGVTMKKEMLMP